MEDEDNGLLPIDVDNAWLGGLEFVLTTDLDRPNNGDIETKGFAPSTGSIVPSIAMTLNMGLMRDNMANLD